MTITVEFGVCCDVKLVVAGFAFDMSSDGGRFPLRLRIRTRKCRMGPFFSGQSLLGFSQVWLWLVVAGRCAILFLQRVVE
jgi:hypothetical protein